MKTLTSAYIAALKTYGNEPQPASGEIRFTPTHAPTFSREPDFNNPATPTRVKVMRSRKV